MSQLSEAADHIHALAAKYEPLVTVSKLLKEVGSLETHIPELERKRDTLFVAIESLEQAVVDTQTKRDQAIADHEARLLELSEQSLRLEQAAQERAQQLIAEGEAVARANAQSVYDAKLAEVNELDSQVVAARDNLLTIQAETDTAYALRDQVLGEKAQAEAGLAEVVRTIEQLSKLGSAQGGPNGAE